jgi:hypothetical protein
MKERTAKVITILLSVLLVSSVMAAIPDLAGAQLTTGPYYPAAAYDPELNRYLVVYQDVQYVDPDYLYPIYGQFVRLNGVPVGDPFQISEAGNSKHGPSIARGSDGRFLAVWDAQVDFDAPVLIVGQFVNPDGTLDGTNFTISDAVGFKMRPRVASAPDHGRFLVVWNDSRDGETNGNDIYGQLISEDGTLLETTSGSNVAVSDAYGDQYESSVAYDSANGRFMAIWMDYRSEVNTDIYGQLINADWGGEPLRGSHYLTASNENFPISTESTDSQYLPALAFDDVNNRFLVVWQDCRDQGACFDIYGQLVNGYFDGMEDILDYYGTDPEVNFMILDGGAGIGDLSIAKDNCNNGFLLAWPDYRSGLTNDIYGALLNEDGSLRDSDFVISQSANDELLPSVAVNGNCGALVAFEDQAPSVYILGLAVIGGLADIIVTPSPVDFGDLTVGNASTQEITLQNNGDVNLTVTSWEILGTDAGMFGVASGGSHPCGQTPVVLTPGSSCTLDATFTPASGGDKTATLRVYSNDPETPSADVVLNGSGLAYTKITVLTPNGKEIFGTGERVDITWGAPASAAKFKLFYSVNNGVTWVKITPDFVLEKSYPWTVPSSLTANKKSCKVKVVGYKANGVSVGSDQSNAAFTIEVVKLNYPNGAEVFSPSDTVTLTWTVNQTKDEVASVKLYYTMNNGTTWKTITTVPKPTTALKPMTAPLWPSGEYEWTTLPVVQGPKTKCRVKVVLKSAKGVTLGSDVSDAVFTITNER